MSKKASVFGVRSALQLVLFTVIVLLISAALFPQERSSRADLSGLREEGQSLREAEIRRQARALGIDLSDPDRAVAQARQMGVPDSLIRKFRAVAGRKANMDDGVQDIRKTGVSPADSAGRGVSLSGRADQPAGIAPDTVRPDTGKGLPYFGYNFFRGVPDAFQPGRAGPVDEGYLIGPGDELRLIVWGSAEFQYDLTVDREGRVFVPNVGQLMVAGTRLKALRSEMKQWLSQSYSGLTESPPTAFMDLTVARLQPIHVYVLGEVRNPGGYTLNSNSTVFNALYSVGGPLRRGSLRDIRVIRDGKQVASVDMYNHLLQGYEPDDLRLQNNDRIFIPVRKKTVSIRGAVRRPAHYELLEGERFSDLLRYSGGLTAEAYGKRFQIARILPITRRSDPSVAREVRDYSLENVLDGERTVPLRDGDRVRILTVVDRFRNVVSVSGEVYQPGTYELSDTLRTVRDLIRQADGLTPEAYLEKADLIRHPARGQATQLSVHPGDILGGASGEDIPLRPNDSLRVYSLQELRAPRVVNISGHVRSPGSYVLRDSMTVRDLLFRAGGLADSVYLKSVYLDRADLFRETPDGRDEIIISFDLEAALQGEGWGSQLLQPKDEIRIYSREVDQFLTRKFVYINGAVKNPGRYRYQVNMTLADLLLQSGGFTEGADLREVEISRPDRSSEENGRAEILRVPLVPDGFGEAEISFALEDTTLAMRNARAFPLQYHDRVYVRQDPAYELQDSVLVTGEVRYPGEYTLVRDNERLSDIIRRAGGLKRTAYPKGGRLIRGDDQLITRIDAAVNGDPDADVILQPGDEIVIPPQPNTVSVQGNVANTGLLKHEQGRRLYYYIKRAGGTGERVEHIYLTQASGATYRVTPRWYWLDPNPVVDDGAVIRVTQKPPKTEQPFDLGKTITDVTQIVSTTLTILVLATRLQGG